MRFLRPLLTSATTVLLVPVLTHPALVQAATNNDPITGKPTEQSSVIDYVNAVYQFMAVVGGLLAVLMLIYAGYRYMTSYGDPENIKDAKDIVEKALIGLALLILAALILNTVNPRTAQDPCKPTYNNQGENTNQECGNIDFSKPKGR